MRQGKAELLMKGSLHSDEILAAVIAKETGLRTGRRLSHVFLMDVPTYHKVLIITDAAINIAPTLEDKVDICQNAIDLARAFGLAKPKVAILAAVETVNSKMPATIDAAALCKMAERGQIKGGMLDGPLAFDNAISSEAAKIKGIVSDVAGDPDILLAPDLESGNMMAKQLSFLANADSAGLVLGAKVPVILTSRADSLRSRIASCAVAVLAAHARRQPPPKGRGRHGRLRAGLQRGLLEPEVLRVPPAWRRRLGPGGARADRRHRHVAASDGQERRRPFARQREARRVSHAMAAPRSTCWRAGSARTMAALVCSASGTASFMAAPNTPAPASSRRRCWRICAR